MNINEKQKELQKMKRVQQIYCHSLYQVSMEKNMELEKERMFCRHDLSHFLDVARLAYIFALERGYSCSKEEIYAAALLHDIGRWKQYLEGVPHEKAGAQIAENILLETGFDMEERERILRAIGRHRSGDSGTSPLAEILYDADKISRACYACPAEKGCNWEEQKKNMEIAW